jgi:hypothetical protein
MDRHAVAKTTRSLILPVSPFFIPKARQRLEFTGRRLMVERILMYRFAIEEGLAVSHAPAEELS